MPAWALATPSHKLEGIQAARFAAALLVVLTHVTFYVASRTGAGGIWRGGAQGVSIFFVISGFVMMLSAAPLRGRPGAFRRFATARIVRIVPLYWLLNAVKLVQIVVAPATIFAHPTVANVLWSLLFVPSRNANGVVETFYGVGWTLNFEMFFYVLVALTLVLRRPLLSTVAPVLLAVAALSLIRTDDWPAVTDLCRPVVLNFVWGMAIAAFYARGIRLPGPAAAAAVVGALAVMLAWPYLFALELQYAVLVAGVVSLEPVLAGRVPRSLIFGGDASYSLYLIHPLAGTAAAVVFGRLHLAPPVTVALVVAVCLATSALVYVVVERPLTRILGRRTRVAPPRVGPATPNAGPLAR